MNIRHRLVWLIAAITLLSGCQESNQGSSQMDKPEVVRLKIAQESSKSDANLPGSKSVTQTSDATATEGESQKEASVKGSASSGEDPSTTTPASADPAMTLLASKDTASTYRYQGSLDPFLPLIREEKTKSSPSVVTNDQPQVKKRIPQTPLEKIDLSQLTLTAVFRDNKRAMAMVEESTGKGYIVKKGAYIGLDGGKITGILKDRVLITETSTDVMGKHVTVKRELKLRQFSGE